MPYLCIAIKLHVPFSFIGGNGMDTHWRDMSLVMIYSLKPSPR